LGSPSTHCTDSGTKLLGRGWTLSFSGVAQGVRCRLSAAVLEFSPVNERVKVKVFYCHMFFITQTPEVLIEYEVLYMSK